jgi:hypothetical protein
MGDPISTSKKLGVVVRVCHPSCAGNIIRKITVQAGINLRPYLKNKVKGPWMWLKL